MALSGCAKKNEAKPDPRPQVVFAYVEGTQPIGGKLPAEAHPVESSTLRCNPGRPCEKAIHRSVRIDARPREATPELLARARKLLAGAAAPPGTRLAYAVEKDDTQGGQPRAVAVLAIGSPFLTGDEIVGAEAREGNAVLGTPGFPKDEAVLVRVSPEGSRRLADATARAASEGRRVAFVVDDEVLLAAAPRAAIEDGAVLVSLGFGPEAKAAAERIADELRARTRTGAATERR